MRRLYLFGGLALLLGFLTILAIKAHSPWTGLSEIELYSGEKIICDERVTFHNEAITCYHQGGSTVILWPRINHMRKLSEKN